MDKVNRLLQENTNEEVTLTLLLYRIDKLEEEQRRENKEIMELLHTIQKNQHINDEKLVQHTTELTRVNARLDKLEQGKVNSAEFDKTCDNVTKRLDNYKQIIFGIVIAVGAMMVSELIKLI